MHRLGFSSRGAFRVVSGGPSLFFQLGGELLRDHVYLIIGPVDSGWLAMWTFAIIVGCTSGALECIKICTYLFLVVYSMFE